MGADIEDEVAVESDDKAEDGEEMSDEEFDRYLEGLYGESDEIEL